MHRIFATPVSSVYPLYVTKVERKGRTTAELDEVICWLTGFDESDLRAQLAAELGVVNRRHHSDIASGLIQI